MPSSDPENAGGGRFDIGDDEDEKTGDAPGGVDVGGVLDGAGGGDSGGGGGTADPHVSQLVQTYYGIWGIMPPPGYVERFTDQNVFEFALQERMKPAFRWTQPFRDKFSEYAGIAARIMGTR